MEFVILRLPDVMAKTGLSRSSIYERVHKGTFPSQVSLGGRAVGWPSDEVNSWVESRIKEGRANV